MTDARKTKLRRKLQESRYRLCVRFGDFAHPMKDMLFVAVEGLYRMSTNGECIYFDPAWLQKLSNAALDFMLSHQLMHIEKEHLEREKYYMGDRFHLGCDIVVNAALMKLGLEYASLPGVGKIFTQTFYPCCEGAEIDAYEAFEGIPFDPSTMTKGKRRTYMIDTDLMWDRKDDRGECGIIVLAPWDETPDDLYYEYPPATEKLKSKGGTFKGLSFGMMKGKYGKGMRERGEGWEKTVEYDLRKLKCMKESETHGIDERLDERLWMKMGTASVNWKSILNAFVQPEMCDYSFSPPDRRYINADFFLPDYNVCEMKVREVLFMVDTSASVDNEMLSRVYTELYDAVCRFEGRLTGRVAFFDSVIHNEKTFGSIAELERIVPGGGGGTDYGCIFKYVKNRYYDESPASIVIFTDGEAPFPDAKVAGNIPVLWVFTKGGNCAPWGQSVGIT